MIQVTEQFKKMLKESDFVELGIFLAEAQLGGEEEIKQCIIEEIKTRYPAFQMPDEEET